MGGSAVPIFLIGFSPLPLPQKKPGALKAHAVQKARPVNKTEEQEILERALDRLR
jgi:hypothetical protein